MKTSVFLIFLLSAASAWGQSSLTSSLSVARSQHGATLLPDGKVLVMGGRTDNNTISATASAELYNPVTAAWSGTGPLATPRYGHTTTLLATGKVLVTGGINSGNYHATVELYDPATGTWSSTGNLGTARLGHTATLLQSGKVLVTGGLNNGVYLGSAEIYDPVTGTWAAAGSLSEGRDGHTATLLGDGKVLVAGGGKKNGPGFLPGTELYDPGTGAWTFIGNLAQARQNHTATLLPNGKVIVVGGYHSNYPLRSSEIFDPASNSWTSAGDLPYYHNGHTATLLPDGTVLIAGSTDGVLLCALYNPVSSSWSLAGELTSTRSSHTSTLLPGGAVLIAGGYASGAITNSAELYNPSIPSAPANIVATVTLASGKCTLLVNGKTGATYQLQRRADLASGAWETIRTVGPVATDGPLTIEDLQAPPDRAFYRIAVTGL